MREWGDGSAVFTQQYEIARCAWRLGVLAGTAWFSPICAIVMATMAVMAVFMFATRFESLNEKSDELAVDLRDAASYSHWSRVTIRFGDEDRLGHVNNASYAVWFEAARIGYFESLYAPKVGLDTVLARLLIDYVQESRFPGEVDVGSRLLSIGNKSLRSGYGVFLDGQCLATSECVNVFFDPQSRTSIIPPAAVRVAMEEEIARLQP